MSLWDIAMAPVRVAGESKFLDKTRELWRELHDQGIVARGEPGDQD